MSNSINLNTEKNILVMQDKVLVSVKIIYEGTTRLEVQKVLKQKVHELFTQLKNFNDLESFTQHQNINPIYQREGVFAGHVSSSYPTNIVIGFMGEIHVGISTKNFKALNEALELTQDLCELHQVQMGVSDAKLREIEDSLTEQAIDEFSKRAELISHSFKFASYSLKDIVVSSLSNQNKGYMEVASAAAFGAHSLSGAKNEEIALFYIEPKQEKLAIRVQGTIQLH